MREVEVKVLEIDKESILKKLKELGAKLIFNGVLESYYCKLSKDEILRVRKFGNDVLVTYKRRIPNKELKVSEEIEIKTDNLHNTIELFKRLGFKFASYNKKIRISLKIGSCEIEIEEILEDSYINELKRVRKKVKVPTYMEIEGPENEIYELIKTLNIDRSKVKPFNTKQLIEYYANKSQS